MNAPGPAHRQRNRAFLEAVWRHPWATIGTLQIEAGLTGYGVRQALRIAKKGMHIETLRIANKGQPHPPGRYGLTPGGAYATKLSISNAPERAKDLLAAPQLDHVRRRVLADPALRARTIWSISPWRAAAGVKLDALLCVRNRRGAAVLVALAAPPEEAVMVWHILELIRRWTRPGIALAILAAPQSFARMPLLAGGLSWRERIVYLRLDHGDGSSIDDPSEWVRCTPSAPGPGCPWDDPELVPGERKPNDFQRGRVPQTSGAATIAAWIDGSASHFADLVGLTLSLTHGQIALLASLLSYPAFTATELAPLAGLGVRGARFGLRRLEAAGWVERMPLFAQDRRVLTEQALDTLAYRFLETPGRFRSSRAWATDPWPFTGSPVHMARILAFMKALLDRGSLSGWDLVQARYAYAIAAKSADLARPRTIHLVPDSRGVLEVGGREIPFWLEIDRGTRAGASLTRQLEKYVLARFAVAATAPIPMLLYVVAKDRGSEETRLRDIARRLVGLVRQHRLAQAPAILLSTWGLLTEGQREGRPSPLRPVWRAPWRLEILVSPAELIGSNHPRTPGRETA